MVYHGDVLDHRKGILVEDRPYQVKWILGPT